MNKLKENLIEKCIEFVKNRLNTVNEIISSNRIALLSETKSSAGDKHETARAHLQLEIEKASMQLPSIRKMHEVLNRIDRQSKHEIVKIGSLVITETYNYFICISLGVLNYENHDYLVISPASPIGSLLLGKIEKERIVFNGKDVLIKEIY